MTDRVLFVTMAAICAVISLLAVTGVLKSSSKSTPAKATVISDPGLKTSSPEGDTNGSQEAADATASDPSATQLAADNTKTVESAQKTLTDVVAAMEACQSANLSAGYAGCTAARLIEDTPTLASVLNSTTMKITIANPTKAGYNAIVVAPTVPHAQQFSYFQNGTGVVKHCRPTGTKWCETGTW